MFFQKNAKPFPLSLVFGPAQSNPLSFSLLFFFFPTLFSSTRPKPAGPASLLPAQFASSSLSHLQVGPAWQALPSSPVREQDSAPSPVAPHRAARTLPLERTPRLAAAPIYSPAPPPWTPSRPSPSRSRSLAQTLTPKPPPPLELHTSSGRRRPTSP